MKMKKAFMVLCVSLSCLAFAQQNVRVPILETHEQVVDLGNLLSAGERRALEARLDGMVKRHNFDVVVLTVDSLDGLYAEEYADNFYDYNGYGIDENGNGYGEDRDGILLLVKMSGGQGNRRIHISTRGFGIKAFTYDGWNWILDKLIPMLVSGEYSLAFDKFADYADAFVTQARTGKVYDENFMPERNEFDDMFWIIAGVIVGTIISIITVLVLMRQLKSVAIQKSAANYERSGSMMLTDRSERFLYKNVTRVYNPPKQSSGGGGGSHISSSGASHGGGGRSF